LECALRGILDPLRRSDERNVRGSYRLRTNFRERSQKKADPRARVTGQGCRWCRSTIDKSISLDAVGSFPAYRFFMRDAGCTMHPGTGVARGFHQEIARTGRKPVKINGPGARGEMSFRRGAKNG